MTAERYTAEEQAVWDEAYARAWKLSEPREDEAPHPARTRQCVTAADEAVRRMRER